VKYLHWKLNAVYKVAYTLQHMRDNKPINYHIANIYKSTCN